MKKSFNNVEAFLHLLEQTFDDFRTVCCSYGSTFTAVVEQRGFENKSSCDGKSLGNSNIAGYAKNKQPTDGVKNNFKRK